MAAAWEREDVLIDFAHLICKVSETTTDKGKERKFGENFLSFMKGQMKGQMKH